MTWDVAVWDNVKSGRRAAVTFDHPSFYHQVQVDITDELIRDVGATAFWMALEGIPEPLLFTHGGRSTLAEAMFKRYRKRAATGSRL